MIFKQETTFENSFLKYSPLGSPRWNASRHSTSATYDILKERNKNACKFSETVSNSHWDKKKKK